MPDNPHKSLAQSAKADKFVATFRKHKLAPAKVADMTDQEWDEVAKFLGYTRPNSDGKYVSLETREIVMTRLRGGLV